MGNKLNKIFPTLHMRTFIAVAALAASVMAAPAGPAVDNTATKFENSLKDLAAWTSYKNNNLANLKTLGELRTKRKNAVDAYFRARDKAGSAGNALKTATKNNDEARGKRKIAAREAQ